MLKSVAIAALLMAAATSLAAEGPDLAKVLAGADWSKMETVTVKMTEYAFTPSMISLRLGVPTKLVLRNEGKEHHYFVSEKFFRTIATRKVQGSDGEVKAPAFTAIEVYAGKSMEWFLVATEKGTFDVVCTAKGHADHGMKGMIEVR